MGIHNEHALCAGHTAGAQSREAQLCGGGWQGTNSTRVCESTWSQKVTAALTAVTCRGWDQAMSSHISRGKRNTKLRLRAIALLMSNKIYDHVKSWGAFPSQIHFFSVIK